MNSTYKTVCVVNPVSANGKTRSRWNQLEDTLRRKVTDFDVYFTKRPGDASIITRNALKKNYERIIAIGGDGTLNEVVNGFYNGEAGLVNEDAYLSFIPMGTGGDFARMFDISSHPDRVLQLMTKGQEKVVDTVRTTFTDWEGKKKHRYYINVADVGLGGETCYRVNKNSKVLGGFLSFLMGALYSICAYKNRLLSVFVDDKEIYSGYSAMVAISNGSYIGGGMKIAPQACIDDGYLDIVIIKDASKFELLRNLPSIYSGKHLNHPIVESFRGQRISIASNDNLFIEMDGESPGQGNIYFEVLPQNIKMLL